MGGIANSQKVRAIAFGYDLTMAIVAVFVALLFRLGGLEQLDNKALLAGAIFPFAGAASISFLVMRTYRTSWRHASTTDLVTIVYAASLAVLIYLPISFVTTRLYAIPRSFVLLSWMVLILLMAGGRVSYRLFREGRLFLSRRPMMPGQVPILIIGGGTEAELFLRSLDQTSNYYPVGVLADSGQGAVLRGVPILGTIDDAKVAVDSFDDAGDRPRKFVVVQRDLGTGALDRLVDTANQLGMTVARGPDPTLIRPGTHDKIELTSISVEDLLGRPQIILDPSPVTALLAGKRVLITGAGGSIGAEIVHQVCAIGPSAICIADSSEFNLYTIDAAISDRWPGLLRVSRIMDVRHRRAVEQCFNDFVPDIVFHAAALKHVPLVEANPLEGVWTNVIGTRNVCDAAVAAGCRAMVIISTDKAVNPTNVMGASKRAAESYGQSLAQTNTKHALSTSIVIVRFGNVLGSTGSVVPLFERQLKTGGPLTVTHPMIERFFMTIREAVQLVLQASALGASTADNQGRVFVLDMGAPVKIADLARQMIRLAGLRPDIDVEIHYTGLRPGEKLFEELWHSGEDVEQTQVPRVNIVSPRAEDLAKLKQTLAALEAACLESRLDEVMHLLRSLVPEFSGQSTPHALHQ